MRCFSFPIGQSGKTLYLMISGTTFEKGSDIAAEFVVQGKLYGLAGTDKYRRDLTLPLLYGTPIALAFGLLAALGTALLTMIIAAIGSKAGFINNHAFSAVVVAMLLCSLATPLLLRAAFSRSHTRPPVSPVDEEDEK